MLSAVNADGAFSRAPPKEQAPSSHTSNFPEKAASPHRREARHDGEMCWYVDGEVCTVTEDEGVARHLPGRYLMLEFRAETLAATTQRASNSRRNLVVVFV